MPFAAWYTFCSIPNPKRAGPPRGRLRKAIPMADYIEGKRPIIEALRTQVPIKRILLADNAKRDGLV